MHNEIKQHHFSMAVTIGSTHGTTVPVLIGNDVYDFFPKPVHSN